MTKPSDRLSYLTLAVRKLINRFPLFTNSLSHALAVVATVNVGGVQLTYIGLANNTYFGDRGGYLVHSSTVTSSPGTVAQVGQVHDTGLKSGYGKAYCTV